MAEAFNGKYLLDKSENFDEYMKKIGVGFATRQIGGRVKPYLTITTDGTSWTFKTESTFKNAEVSFKLDEEYNEETPDGRTVKSKCWMEGGKLHQKQTPIKAGDKESDFIREIDADKNLKVTCTCEGVVATRIYKRL